MSNVEKQAVTEQNTHAFRERLFCPGPTPIPRRVEHELGRNLYHRHQDFISIFATCRHKLATLCNTQSQPVILASSGTGAMEAAVVNFTTPGDRVMVIDGGKFGERFGELAQTYDCQVIEYKVPWGESPALEKLTEMLTSCPDLKVFLMQANETSTAVHYPVSAIAAVVRRHHPECLIVIDAVSSLLAHELQIDNWGLDCVLAASQKGFGLPPGLAFIFLSERAQQNFSSRSRFYFDLRAELAGQKEGKSQFTPAINLIIALDHVLDVLLAVGLEQLVHRHTVLASACRTAVSALGLQLFAKHDPSNAVTAITMPPSLDASRVCAWLKEKYRLQVAGGQGKLKTSIVRIAHLGFIDPFDLITAIAALEFSLRHFKHEFSLGSGVTAAMQVLDASQY